MPWPTNAMLWLPHSQVSKNSRRCRGRPTRCSGYHTAKCPKTHEDAVADQRDALATTQPSVQKLTKMPWPTNAMLWLPHSQVSKSSRRCRGRPTRCSGYHTANCPKTHEDAVADQRDALATTQPSVQKLTKMPWPTNAMLWLPHSQLSKNSRRCRGRPTRCSGYHTAKCPKAHEDAVADQRDALATTQPSVQKLTKMKQPQYSN